MRGAAAVGALLFALAGWAGAEEKLTLNFADSPVSAVIEAVGRATGTRFVIEPGLRGRLTIALEDKVTPAEALQVLNAALLTVGYAPVPTPAGGYVVLPIEVAKGGAPWIHRSVSDSSERMVTTLVRLHAANAEELGKQLVPADRSSLVVPYPPTNSLIISAAEDRIAHLLDLLRLLDQAQAIELQVLALRYADAGAIAKQLDTLFPPAGDTRPDLPLRVVAEPRTNSLVVQGAASRVAEVRRYVELVDQPARSKGRIHVVRVMNADAAALAEHLSQLSFEDTVVPGGIVPGSTGLGVTPAPTRLRGKSFTIAADTATNSLLIAADAATFALLSETISELDRIPPRIAVEATVFSVQTTHALDLGFDALLPLILPDDVGDLVAFAVFGNPAPLIASEIQKAGPIVARFTRRPLVVPVVLPDGTPTTVVVPAGGAQLTASQGEVMIQTLSSPYLLAASGEEQHIFAGSNVPVPVSAGAITTTDGQTTGTPSTTTPGRVGNDFQISQQITRQDVGIDLRVKPVALSDHLSMLDVELEISSVAPTLDASTGSQIGPTLDKFKLTAKVRIDDGSVVLIASAPKETSETIETGVPWLRKIPILGWLFKSVSDRIERQRLVVALQATELHSPSEERAEQMERVIALQRRAQRVQPLRALTTEPYALLVATRGTRAEAEAVLPEIADLPGQPLVIEWSDGETTRYDVYLTGFPEIGPLGSESLRLRERGFTPRFEIAGPPRS